MNINQWLILDSAIFRNRQNDEIDLIVKKVMVRFTSGDLGAFKLFVESHNWIDASYVHKGIVDDLAALSLSFSGNVLVANGCAVTGYEQLNDIQLCFDIVCKEVNNG